MTVLIKRRGKEGSIGPFISPFIWSIGPFIGPFISQGEEEEVSTRNCFSCARNTDDFRKEKKKQVPNANDAGVTLLRVRVVVREFGSTRAGINRR